MIRLVWQIRENSIKEIGTKLSTKINSPENFTTSKVFGAFIEIYL
jgi:hypothetical protein